MTGATQMAGARCHGALRPAGGTSASPSSGPWLPLRAAAVRARSGGFVRLLQPGETGDLGAGNVSSAEVLKGEGGKPLLACGARVESRAGAECLLLRGARSRSVGEGLLLHNQVMATISTCKMPFSTLSRT